MAAALLLFWVYGKTRVDRPRILTPMPDRIAKPPAMPADVSLPFFAYGIFKPGQLGFLVVRDAVDRREEGSIRGELRERDGLAILDAEGSDSVPGYLLTFAGHASTGAYEHIATIEPEHQYRWAIESVATLGGSRRANVLIARSPRRGSTALDREWDGRQDPLFTTALMVVEDVVESWRGKAQHPEDMEPFFHLQMAYLLLWSALERYTAFRYGLGGEVWQRVRRIAEEPAFHEGLQKHVRQPEELFSAQSPKDKVRLDIADPEASVDYLYQMRSNIAHRGKGVGRDVDRVLRALDVLVPTFRLMLESAFKEARA